MSKPNYKYEQVSLGNDTNSSSQQPQDLHSNRAVENRHERTDLENSFNLDEEEEEQTESHHLLHSTAVTIDQENNFSTATATVAHQSMPMTHSTDGVFSNMAAKPESDPKVEIPPSYEEASADATPPYWQTTVITPTGYGDTTLVEGLPVGSILSFLWNLMVSASFQLVGFMLTYLLHTTHAAKDGARAGLGVSLIQYGFYVRSRGTLDEDFDYDGEGHETGQDATQAQIVAYIMMFVGWFIILRALSDYNRARKMETIITAEPSVDVIV